jgi:hypothetical protein
MMLTRKNKLLGDKVYLEKYTTVACDLIFATAMIV